MSQVCCCSPYPALVTTEAVGGTSCSCSHKAGWALILMAILVPILIICDIMLICYCCYRGKCCFFSSTESEKMGELQPQALNALIIASLCMHN